MMISTKGRYALMIMAYLAQHRNEGAVSLKDIADHEQIGLKYLESIISTLNKGGLVDSVRGKNGGYMLNRSPEEYSVLSILNIAEGTLAPVACIEDNFECDCKDTCRVHTLWQGLDSVITDYLASKTLADIS